MKYHHIIFALFLALVLTSCKKEDIEKQWTLVGYANTAGELNCTYPPGEITWKFNQDILAIDGQLVSPWALVPCYEVDDMGYQKDFAYTIVETDDNKILTVEGLGLEAIISDDNELVIEVISSTDFIPAIAGVKVYFEEF